MSMLVKEFFWVVVGAIAAIAVLLISIWSEFVAPRVHARRLKAPSDVWFNIQSMQAGSLRYVVQDDEAHQVRELALPSNFTAEIEIGYRPRLAFREEKLIVGCEGDEAGKPIILGYLNKLV